MKIADTLPLRGPAEVAEAAKPAAGAKPAERGFAAVLEDSLSEVNRLQQKADASISALATGGKASLHETMIAMEEASVAFKLMMQVRNKIVEAYQEVMRIQV
ncbi:MAG: flagellar hook-basal body complex protein FliE [Thermodesulfobacteriota bacterium]